MLLSFREMYGLGEVGAIVKVLLFAIWKDICRGASEFKWFLELSKWDITPSLRF